MKPKRTMAAVLCLLMLLGLMPVSAFAEGGGDPLALRFVCDETVASVTVYDPAGLPLPVGADGIHHLTPGTYFYSATAEGYESTGLQAFTIPADAAGDQELRISLTPVPGSVPPGAAAPGETPPDASVPGQTPVNAPDPNAPEENPEDDGKLRIRPVDGSLTLTIERETRAESAVPPEVQKLLEGKQKPLLTADGKPVEKKLWLKTPDAEELYLDRLAVEKEIGYYTTDWTVLNLTDEEGDRKNLLPASGWYDVTASGPATEPYQAYEPVFALVTLHWDAEGDIVDRDVQILETTHTPTKSSWSFSTDTLSTLVIAVPTDRPVESEEAAAKKDRPAFAASSTVDGVTVTVSAPSGVFPADAALWVQRVPLTEEIDAAVESERDEQKTVAVSYTFDIRVVNPETMEEYQPEEGQNVSVSFALAEVADENLETRVYHVTEEESTGALTAEALDVSESGLTATAETDGFSYYQVEFTYEKLEYVLPGDTSVPLAEILTELGLSGDVTEVSCSNTNLFSCDWTENRWVVTAHRAFSSTEWMKVTLNGVVYEITVTDAQDGDWEFDCDGSSVMITKYKGTGGDVVIPDKLKYYGSEIPVTGIGDYAFASYESLTSITIPASVTTIGYGTFQGCDSLKSIEIPKSVKSIGASAFEGCLILEHVTFVAGSELTSIGAYAFLKCGSLQSIEIPSSVTTIGASAFSECTSLGSVTFIGGSKLTSIGAYAFQGCGSLKSIEIPKSVKSIGANAFMHCGYLGSVTFVAGSELASIGDRAFQGCGKLKSIEIPSSVTSIGEEAFGNCGLESITIKRDGSTPLSLASKALNSSGVSQATLIYTGIIPDGQNLKFTITPDDIGYKISDDNSTLSWSSYNGGEATLTAEVGLSVSYVDENGTEKTAICTPITESMTYLDGGWYALTEDVTAAGTINISGEVNLILCSGKTYTLESVYIDSGGSLTLWGQSAGSGTIQATSKGNCAIYNEGTLTMYAGTVMSQEQVGVSSYNSFTMNGGTVKGGGTGVVINGGSFTMNGGTVEGGSYGVGNSGSGSFLVTGDAPKTITGEVRAIFSTVKNGVAGTGWYTTAGSGTGMTIPISEGGQTFTYIKVQFPAVPDPATAPTIDKQPTALSWTYGDTTKEKKLSVSASVSDGGTRSYQWYLNTADSTTGGTEVTGATSEEYTVPGGTETDAGTYYYYCVVTNTKNGATASTTSSSAKVTVNPAPLTITAKNQYYVYNGQIQGPGDTTYVDPADIAEKVTVVGRQGNDTLTSVTIDGQGQEVGPYNLIPSGATITNGSGSVTANYNITYEKGTLTILPPAVAEIRVTKDLTGRKWSDSDSFTFTLAAVTENAPMPANTTAKATRDSTTADFGTIEYDKAGEYRYTITETNGGLDGVSYDTTSHTVLVTVAQSDPKQAPTATVAYDGQDSLTITNTFTPATATLEVTKSLKSWRAGDSFTFTLAAVTENAPMPATAQATATEANPAASFGEVTYDRAGTWEYTITEVDGGISGVNYDTTSHRVTVTVTKNKDKDTNALSASVKYDGENSLEVTNSRPLRDVVIDSSMTGGTVTATPASAAAGDPVTLTVKPDAGSELTSLTVTDTATGDVIKPKQDPNDPNLYSFVMPAGSVEVTATFKEILYTVVEGADSSWLKGSKGDASIKVKRDPKDETCFQHFRKDGKGSVAIDGAVLSEDTSALIQKDYKAEAGSTVITLHKKMLNRLSAGKHTVTITFDDGSVSTGLTILVPPGGYSPGTGDSSRIGFWSALMVLAGLGFVGADYARRRLRRPRYVGKH